MGIRLVAHPTRVQGADSEEVGVVATGNEGAAAGPATSLTGVPPQGRPKMYLRPGYPPDDHLPWDCLLCSAGVECWDLECTWGTYVPPYKRSAKGNVPLS